MDQGTVVEIAQKAIWTIILVSSPMLLSSVIVGLIIAVFQATTQIHEQTLTFVPKIITVLVVIALFGVWMLTVLTEFAESTLSNISQYIR